MLELLKIKRDINWLIDQIKCLIRKSDLDSPLSATEWSANHSTITGNPYIVDCFVWFEGKVYKSLINNNIYPPTNATYWANLGLGHLLLEEQTDWNATTGRALLKNKPNLSQYALDSNVVHKTGNETIAGFKTFNETITVSSITSNSGQLVLASGGTNIIISDDSEQIIANREFIAPSLRIPEGTSTQFLKADGSVDNNVYAENANVIHTTGDETKNGSLTVITSYLNAPVSVAGFSDALTGVLGYSDSGGGIDGLSNTGIAVQGSSQTGLGGKFNTTTGTKIVSFLSNSVEQAYILATGLFKANKILINTTVDNGIDALQVDGSVRTTSDIKVNGISVGRGGSITSVLMGNGALQNNTNGNSNVAIGSQALFITTNASFLVAIGQKALYSNTTGSAGVAVGAEALSLNTTGNNNTAVGREALKANTIGFNNTAVGRSSMLLNVSGNNNTVFGTLALQDNISGDGNVAIGSNALSTTTGNNNIGIGLNALQNNTSGGGNIGIGQGTSTLGTTNTNSIVIGNAAVGLGSNTTVIGTPTTTITRLRGAVQGGSFVKDLGLSTEFLKADGSTDTNVMLLTGNQSIDGIKNFQKDLIVNGFTIGRGGGNQIVNVAIGQSALSVNTTGFANTAIGRHALITNTIGNENTANGHQALFSNTSGNNNTASGSYALIYNTTGSFNTAIGQSAFFNSTTGSNNVAIGKSAGSVIGDKITLATILNNSLMLGFNASPLANNQTNQIVIGHNAIGLGSDTSVIGNSATTVTGLYGNIRLVSGMATAPASATAPGTLGDVRVTSGFIYVCIATNTWVRTALTSW